MSGVRLLGYDGKIEWTQGADGLKIAVPERRPCDHAVAFAITGILPAAGAGQ